MSQERDMVLGRGKRGGTGDTGPVECLGMTFASDDDRRAYFAEKLMAKLADPEFRKTPGFPKGSDADILRLSDPPYYTACPNPFLQDFVRVHGKPFDPTERYEREPFAVDTSVGKSDALYKAHGYHTKVPHLAIVPSILHYTAPGDIVLDGFCGTGMTGVAAQWCGVAPQSYRDPLQLAWRKEGRAAPQWGARRAILGDLGPAATSIAAGFNLPFDPNAFSAAARRILDEVEDELGWMYETSHGDARSKGRINYTVWSEVFSCPECSGEVVFVNEAVEADTKKVAASFPCPNCRAELTKDNLERSFESFVDPGTREVSKRIRLRPVLINYNAAGKAHEKSPDAQDTERIRRVAALPLPPEVPTNRFPIETMAHGSRIAPKGFTHIHHFFLPRTAQVLAAFWRKAQAVADVRLRNALRFWIDSHFVNLSVENRYRPEVSFPYNPLTGVYYIPSAVSEADPFTAYRNKLKRIEAAFGGKSGATLGTALVTTGDCGALFASDASIDYIFTDPPFGENIYYADLNYLVESWHRVLTDSRTEAIVDRAKKKGTLEYQDLMRRCFSEYHRVLKPGRWMTVVFSNSSNAIWRSIQEAMGSAGFVVADVRTLDKQQGSYRQVTSSAVKQDLVISAYKPTAALTEKFKLGTVGPESAWAFVSEHLARAPRFVAQDGESEVVAERTPQVLHDRMIAFHVQRTMAVPISGPEFLAGLAARYPERDGMYFLPDQVPEYDRKRLSVRTVRQPDLFVNDEASAIRWVRLELQRRPQTFQDLQPAFMRELKAWAKHEQTVELKVILEQNFLCYRSADGLRHDGSSDYDGSVLANGLPPVPPQIHSYLSSNYKDLRSLAKNHPDLVAKAEGRWYVPDPNKMADVVKLREKALLREFQGYKESTQRKLKLFRTEAVRVGFKGAYDAGDYRTIVEVAAKLPDIVLQEDEKLLMYFDVARMRLGEES